VSTGETRLLAVDDDSVLSGEVDEDIVRGVSVQGLLEQLLVEEVTDETGRSSENEQTVESSTLQVVGSLLLGESTGSLQQVAERDGNGTIDVQDQRVLLGAGDRLDAEGIVEGRGGREVLLDIVDDEDDSQVRVGLGLDLVSDTGDELVGLSHRVDEFSRGHAGLETTGHLGGGTVEGTSESVTNGQETGTERRDEVLAGTGGDDGVGHPKRRDRDRRSIARPSR